VSMHSERECCDCVWSWLCGHNCHGHDHCCVVMVSRTKKLVLHTTNWGMFECVQISPDIVTLQFDVIFCLSHPIAALLGTRARPCDRTRP
jgi:hypothetical protein